jgi:hypothetical protein
MKLEELRKKMTEEHNTKITKLITKFGEEKSIQKARKELFKVGIELGQKSRQKLGIDNSISDFLKAAKILYKILGIKFQTKQLNKNEIVMYVNRCSLSKYYNDKTCQALSATDEGVVRGLNPNFKMTFQERITSGASRCMAQIIIRENG